MNNSEYNRLCQIEQVYKNELARLGALAVSQCYTGMSERQAQKESGKLSLSFVDNAARLRDGVISVIKNIKHEIIADATINFLTDEIARDIAAGKIKNTAGDVGGWWLNIIELIKNWELTTKIWDRQEFQFKLRIACATAKARAMIAAHWPNNKDQIIDGINARLDDPSIPDTDEAIADFFESIIAEIEAGTLPEAADLKSQATIYDLAKIAIETSPQWRGSIALYKNGDIIIAVDEYRQELFLNMRLGTNRHRVKAGFMTLKGWQFDLPKTEYEKFAERARATVSAARNR